jgi:hypothetical protein
LSIPPLPRCDRCPELHPPIPFLVGLSFLRYSGSLPPRSFIRLLPLSCCLRPRSLMPFFILGPYNVRPLRVFCTTLCWSYLLRSCPLRRDTSVFWVVLLSLQPIPFTVHNFPGSEFFLRRSSCAMPFLHRAIPACRQQPTSPGIHNVLRSVPFTLHVALQLHSGPYAASSIL